MMSHERESASDLNDPDLNKVFVVIPMLNEAGSIGMVLNDLPAINKVVVVDNGSDDDGPEIARAAGAEVIPEPQRGYGKACLTGIACVENFVQADDSVQFSEAIIVFLDADYSDYPDELPQLVQPILDGEYDFVIGSRATGSRESGAMPLQAMMGNWLACTLVKLFWRTKFTDLGPFRAIGLESLAALNMVDENFGWTIEMQIKAINSKLRILEVPVSYRRRVGVSKISGTISGTIRAGYKIIYTIFRYRFLSP